MSTTTRWALLFALSLALGTFLIVFHFVSLGDVVGALRQLRSPSLALRLAGAFVQSLKLKVICRSVRPIRYLDAVLIYLGGNFISSITPGYQIAGKPIRAFYLKNLYGNGKASFPVPVMLDRFFNLIAIVLLRSSCARIPVPWVPAKCGKDCIHCDLSGGSNFALGFHFEFQMYAFRSRDIHCSLGGLSNPFFIVSQEVS